MTLSTHFRFNCSYLIKTQMTKIIYVTNTILIILKTTTSTSHDDISFFTPCMAANIKRKSFEKTI